MTSVNLLLDSGSSQLKRVHETKERYLNLPLCMFWNMLWRYFGASSRTSELLIHELQHSLHLPSSPLYVFDRDAQSVCQWEAELIHNPYLAAAVKMLSLYHEVIWNHCKPAAFPVFGTLKVLETLPTRFEGMDLDSKTWNFRKFYIFAITNIIKSKT